MLRNEISYRTQIIKDPNGIEEPYIQVTHMTTQRFPLGESKVIYNEYPKVPLSTKFRDTLNNDIMCQIADENRIKFIIRNCVTMQLKKAVSLQCIVVDNKFDINGTTYFIIYLPSRHCVYNIQIEQIINKISENCNNIKCLILLPHREYSADRKDIELPTIPTQYFSPYKFAQYIWEILTDSNHEVI